MEKTANDIHSWNSGEQLTSQDLNTIKSYLQELEQKLGQVITATSNDAEKSVIIGSEGKLELKTNQDTISNLSSIIKAQIEKEIMYSSGWPYTFVGIRRGLGDAESPSSNFDTTSQSVPVPLRDFILFGAALQDGTPTESSPIPINVAGITGNISIVVCKDSQNDEDGTYTIVPTPGGLASLSLSSEYSSLANVQGFLGNYYIADAIDLHEKKYIKRLAYKRAYAKEISGSKYIALSNVEDSAPATLVGYNNLLCTHYASTLTSTFEPAPNLSIRYSKNGGSIFVKDTAHNTNLATAKQWFKENEIYILYILNEPIITDLTDAQLAAFSNLCSPDGAGRIFTTDATNPEMYAQYYLNLQSLLTT